MAYRQPRLEMLARTLPMGTSSLGKSRSTIRPIFFKHCSMYSAYSLFKKQDNFILSEVQKLKSPYVRALETTIISQSFRSGLMIGGTKGGGLSSLKQVQIQLIRANRCLFKNYNYVIISDIKFQISMV